MKARHDDICFDKKCKHTRDMHYGPCMANKNNKATRTWIECKCKKFKEPDGIILLEAEYHPKNNTIHIHISDNKRIPLTVTSIPIGHKTLPFCTTYLDILEDDANRLLDVKIILPNNVKIKAGKK